MPGPEPARLDTQFPSPRLLTNASSSYNNNNSFRPGPAKDFYGSFRIERSPIEAPPCDQEMVFSAQRLMNDAAKLGIKVRHSKTYVVFVPPSKRMRQSSTGGSRYVAICDCRFLKFLL